MNITTEPLSAIEGSFLDKMIHQGREIEGRISLAAERIDSVSTRLTGEHPASPKDDGSKPMPMTSGKLNELNAILNSISVQASSVLKTLDDLDSKI